ncbi:YcxB family protein [Luteibacter pinisoli]|nr:YcxB family protein [Luteibacter pinisoli]
MEDAPLVIRPRLLSFGELLRGAIGIYRWSASGVLIIPSIIFLITTRVERTGSAWNVDWHRPLPYIAYGMAGMVALQLWGLHHQFKRQAKDATFFTFTTNGLTHATNSEESTIAWHAVRSVCVSAHMIYIFTSRWKAYYLPRSAHDARLVAMAREAGVTLRGSET